MEVNLQRAVAALRASITSVQMAEPPSEIPPQPQWPGPGGGLLYPHEIQQNSTIDPRLTYSTAANHAITQNFGDDDIAMPSTSPTSTSFPLDPSLTPMQSPQPQEMSMSTQCSPVAYTSPLPSRAQSQPPLEPQATSPMPNSQSRTPPLQRTTSGSFKQSPLRPYHPPHPYHGRHGQKKPGPTSAPGNSWNVDEDGGPQRRFRENQDETTLVLGVLGYLDRLEKEISSAKAFVREGFAVEDVAGNPARRVVEL